jgi:hypothetical protein
VREAHGVGAVASFGRCREDLLDHDARRGRLTFERGRAALGGGRTGEERRGEDEERRRSSQIHDGLL